MNIPVEELNTFETSVIYEEGYRIVYYYEKYHEAEQGLYAKKIEDFINFFNKEDKNIKFKDIDDILDRFLDLNEKALGVAIYDINQNCIKKKIRDNVDKVNDREVYKEELIYDYNDFTAKDGYRLVYFKNNGEYFVGLYSENIEGFMMEFIGNVPITDETDIPPFISIEDILDRILNSYDIVNAAAIYKVDGTLIARKDRD